jgi:hypothetical protein
MSRVLNLLGLGHTPTEKMEIHEAMFRHPSIRSTIPNSPEGIEDIPPKNAE